MFYVKNLPVWERAMRVGGGLVMMGYAAFALGGMAEWMAVAAAAGLTASGLIGFCPMCALAGRRLQRRQEKT